MSSDSENEELEIEFEQSQDFAEVCEVYENQKFVFSTSSFFKGWRALDPNEGEWSSSNGEFPDYSDVCLKTDYQVSRETIEKEFLVDSEREGDVEGWEYAPDIASPNFRPQGDRYDHVRRRCWVRKSCVAASKKLVPVTLMTDEEITAKVLGQIRTISRTISGSIYLTQYRLVFVKDDVDYLDDDEEPRIVSHLERPWGLELPLCLIGDVTAVDVLPTGELTYSLDIRLRDLRKFMINLHEKHQSRRIVHNRLMKHCFPRSHHGGLYALSYCQSHGLFLDDLSLNDTSERSSRQIDGWKLYDARKEYQRQGIEKHGDRWRVSNINEDYALCDSYPNVLVVPRDIPDDEIPVVADFRSKRRFAVATWVHPVNGRALMRSSQPMTGVRSARSLSDENYIDLINGQGKSPTEESESESTTDEDQGPSGISSNAKIDYRMAILDARPKVNAIFNQAIGGGYENTAFYVACSIDFLNIANVHSIRDSYLRLEAVLYQDDLESTWLSDLERSGWLQHIRSILLGANQAVASLEADKSVLVHCSDGWDRSSQICALAQLLIDPYFRTIEGFAVLIEKDWLSFGHQFELRLGYGARDFNGSERSPIFIQFLDCVYQIMAQFPDAFEFTPLLLDVIATESYACRFGTFLYNKESTRVREHVRQETVSLWTYVLKNRSTFLNPAARKDEHVLQPVTRMPYLRFWCEYYAKWHTSIE
eukprot:Clim_evm33s199 gene=Clim_evmTU33s199